MKKFLLAASFAIISASGYSQVKVNSCGTDQHHQNLVSEHPELLEAKKKFDADFKEYIKTYKPSDKNSLKKASAPKYIIPVVVHVLHNYGSENISDAQIQSEINFLNQSFRNLVSDSTNRRQDTFNGAFYSYKQLAADAEVEFRLARKDPKGNCTNGIVRVQTPLTNKGNDDLKQLSVWDTKRYYNIWVVRAINRGNTVGIAGYAQFPMGFNNGASTDGIIVIHNEFGNIGTSNPGQTPKVTTSTHETGHWLGLYHPFQTQGETCGLDGDEVLDTPPTIFSATSNEPLRNKCADKRYNTCNNEIPDLPDMQENYMDYFIGNCASNMFTKQQVVRMHYVLDNYRRTLWQEDNLISTGVKDNSTATCAPIASFSTTTKVTCAGNKISFTDNSYNSNITAWKWSFPGGTPATATTKAPGQIQYDNPGTYEVTLEVTGPNGTSSVTYKDYVVIQPAAANNPSGYYTADWWYQNNWFDKGWVFDYENDKNKWIRTGATSFNQNACMVYPKDPFNFSSSVGALTSLISPSYNFQGVSNGYFSFNYAFAQGTLSADIGGGATKEELRVYTSVDCGKTWISRAAIGSSTISTIGTGTAAQLASNINFVPANQSKWKEVKIEGSAIPNNSNVKFKIEFKYAGGNNFYLDNVKLGTVTGIEDELAKQIRFSVQPNPFNYETTISYELNKNEDVEIRLFDIAGKELGVLFSGDQAAGIQEFQISKSQFNLQSGLYFVNMNVGGQKFSKKIVVE